jgi:5-methylcytosine-specific restriction endonuclease McrA
MKDFAKSFYKSKAWQAVREAAMKRDARLCVDCLAEGRYTPAEEVHHIEELTPENIHDPSVTLNMSNLVSLCRECHKKRHGARTHRYEVDEFGRVTIK